MRLGGAGNAAVEAAQSGNLELRNVVFSYPLRPRSGGEVSFLPVTQPHRATLTHYRRGRASTRLKASITCPLYESHMASAWFLTGFGVHTTLYSTPS